MSLYKYFNAPFGAVLTGPAQLIDAAAVLRHQFGGGLLHAWQSAAVALHYLDGFEERYRKAARIDDELLRRLEQKGIRVHGIDAGTNVSTSAAARVRLTTRKIPVQFDAS